MCKLRPEYLKNKMSVAVSDEMRSKIMGHLSQLECEKNITIVFAVESGSRSTGLASETSDYDIRFVYFHNDIREYLKISKKEETITNVGVEEIFDWQGWDIKKTIQHLKESNPSLLEWLSSPIIYINKKGFRERVLDVARDMHSHLSLMYHYFSMAKENWKIWIEDKKDEIICKKYFYVIRPLSCLIFIMNKYVSEPNTPINLVLNFDQLVYEIQGTMAPEVFGELQKLIELKKNINSKEKCEPNTVVNNWIIDTFIRFENLVKKDKGSESDVDLKVQSTIRTHKKLTNEAKKIRDIVASNGCTARSNYLTAIGLTLQLLWLDNNPQKETREMPTQIHQLLKDLEIPEHILTEIRNIVDVLVQEEKVPNTNINDIDIYDSFIKPGLMCLYKDNVSPSEYNENISMDEILSTLKFSEKTKQLILKVKRNDCAEFVLRNFIDTLWLLGNMEETQSSRPKDIINTGDNTETIPNELLARTKRTIAELRPKYVVGKNEVLDEWFKSVVNQFEGKTKELQLNLTRLREINSEKRLHYSVANVDASRFDELVYGTLGF